MCVQEWGVQNIQGKEWTLWSYFSFASVNILSKHVVDEWPRERKDMRMSIVWERKEHELRRGKEGARGGGEGNVWERNERWERVRDRKKTDADR